MTPLIRPYFKCTESKILLNCPFQESSPVLWGYFFIAEGGGGVLITQEYYCIDRNRSIYAYRMKQKSNAILYTTDYKKSLKITNV
jgi:hypothetical protein